MPEMIPIGWLHTITAIMAIIAGVISLKNNVLISLEQLSGKVFLIFTVLAAGTALMIFQRGVFGPGHMLAVLTFVAIFVGGVAEKTTIFKKYSPYLQAAAYSGIFLFHMIPAITDGLMRLPVGDPIVTEITDPLLQGFYGLFLLSYVVTLLIQWRWIKNRAAN